MGSITEGAVLHRQLPHVCQSLVAVPAAARSLSGSNNMLLWTKQRNVARQCKARPSPSTLKRTPSLPAGVIPDELAGSCSTRC